MRKLPRVLINCNKIIHNYLEISDHCRRSGIEITGVIKGVAGNHRIISELIIAGLSWIGDSRLENLHRITDQANIKKMLLRLPALSRVNEVIQSVQQSLNSEIEVLEALNRASKGHEVFLMIDLGDLREGVLEAELYSLGQQCRRLTNLSIIGLGANFSCFAGLKPSPVKLEKLSALATFLKEEWKLPIRYISGGNSSSLALVYQGQIPPGINHLRIGEGILLGRETLSGGLLPGLKADAFVVEAEILQVQYKPAVPDGETGFDAFGRRPSFPVQEPGLRLLVNLGHQDAPLTGLKPLDPELMILGGSSDYLVLASSKPMKVGETVRFIPNYWSLLGLMTSPYVTKEYESNGMLIN